MQHKANAGDMHTQLAWSEGNFCASYNRNHNYNKIRIGDQEVRNEHILTKKKKKIGHVTIFKNLLKVAFLYYLFLINRIDILCMILVLWCYKWMTLHQRLPTAGSKSVSCTLVKHLLKLHWITKLTHLCPAYSI